MSVTVKKPRDSKVRHVFGTPAKSQEIFNGVKFNSPSADSNPLVANGSFFAFPWKAKGLVCVNGLKAAGAIADDAPMLEQDENVSDLQFNPFDDHFLAVSGEQNITMWKFGEDGVRHGEEPVHVMNNPHDKRLQNISWHPIAKNIFLTAAVDKLVKVWDVEHGASECQTLPAHEGFITSFSWNYDGTLLATTAKDKMLRIIDPRANKVVSETVCHEGSKAPRAVWLGSKNQIVTVGFIKGVPEREIAIFDTQNLSKKMYGQKLDALPSSIFPYFDPDLSLLYLIGKGDGNMRIYEVIDGAEPLQESGEFKSSVAQAGFAFLPKLCNDVMKCEIARVLKLQDNSVVPIRFEVTRQNSGYIFQSDLYPDTWDMKPVYESKEWLDGATKKPTLTKVTAPQ